MLSIFPAPVIARAIDPAIGIPAKVTFLNLATIRELLDLWLLEHLIHQERLDRLNRKALPPMEPEEPAAKKRVSEGFKKLSDHLANSEGFKKLSNPPPAAGNDDAQEGTAP
jgi:hypothetical protein